MFKKIRDKFFKQKVECPKEVEEVSSGLPRTDEIFKKKKKNMTLDEEFKFCMNPKNMATFLAETHYYYDVCIDKFPKEEMAEIIADNLDSFIRTNEITKNDIDRLIDSIDLNKMVNDLEHEILKVSHEIKVNGGLR